MSRFNCVSVAPCILGIVDGIDLMEKGYEEMPRGTSVSGRKLSLSYPDISLKIHVVQKRPKAVQILRRNFFFINFHFTYRFISLFYAYLLAVW